MFYANKLHHTVNFALILDNKAGSALKVAQQCAMKSKTIILNDTL